MLRRYTIRDIRQHRKNASAAGWRVFSPIRAVWKTGNTPSIPLFSKGSAEEKSLATGSCRFMRCWHKIKRLSVSFRKPIHWNLHSCTVGGLRTAPVPSLLHYSLFTIPDSLFPSSLFPSSRFPAPHPKNPPRGVLEIGHLHIDNFRLNEYNTIDTL